MRGHCRGRPLTEVDAPAPSPLDPYAAPRTLAAASEPVRYWHWLAGACVLTVLAIMWWTDVPRDRVMLWMDSIFPWSSHPPKVLAWMSLFLFRALLEGSICIPAALLLSYAMPSRQVLGASLLALEEWIRSATFLLLAPTPKRLVFWLMVLLLHTALLVTVTAWVSARRRRRVT